MAFALRLSPFFCARRARAFADARGGGAAVEFALVGPVLLLLLSGIFTYGGYFLTAHTVQQIANDAARATVAGLDDEERLQLARDALATGIGAQPHMRGDISQLNLSRTANAITLAVTYDASEDMYWTFEALLPTPSPRISRTATIRLGGF